MFLYPLVGGLNFFVVRDDCDVNDLGLSYAQYCFALECIQMNFRFATDGVWNGK